MSFGKLYLFQENARAGSLFAIARENNLDIELVNTYPPVADAEYLKLNPLNRIPTFVGSDGFILTESIAIAIYFAAQNEKTTRLGKTKQEYASIVRWMSFSNSEILSHLGAWFRPVVGKDPYNKKSVEEARVAALRSIQVLEQHFLSHTFLVGESITLADWFVASQMARAFSSLLDKAWRDQNPHTTRWFLTVTSQPVWKAVADKVELVDKVLEYAPPQK